jgi:hypothetical protein
LGENAQARAEKIGRLAYKMCSIEPEGNTIPVKGYFLIIEFFSRGFFAIFKLSYVGVLLLM